MDFKCENITKNDLSDLIGMISSAFGYTGSRKISEDFPLFYKEENLKHLWAVRSGTEGSAKIVAHAGAFLTSIYIDGQKIPVGGIGGVATVPELRGKGLAKITVKQAVEDLRKSGAVLAFLWSGEYDYYRDLGFELVGRQWSIALPQARASTLLQMAESLAQSSGLDFSSLAFKNNRSLVLDQGYKLWQQIPLRVDRSPGQFKELLSCSGAQVFAASEGSELKAYLVVGKGMDLTGHIHEWAGDEAALLGLLAQALIELKQDLTLLSPQFTPEEAALIYRLEEQSFSAIPQYMSLIRLLDFPSLRKVLVEKARSLSMEPSFLRCEPNTDGSYTLGWATDPDITLSEPEFLKFIFGPDLPSRQANLEPASASAFDSLLPLRLWWWGLDSV